MIRIRALDLSLLLAVFFSLASPTLGAEEATIVDPIVGKLHEKITRFFDRLANPEEGAAFNDLLLGSPLSERTAAVKELIERSKELPGRYGTRRDSEQISAKRIGKDVIVLKYLLKYEKFPVVWYFVYYRDFARLTPASDDYWIVISMRFDTQVELLGY